MILLQATSARRLCLVIVLIFFVFDQLLLFRPTSSDFIQQQYGSWLRYILLRQ